jgi:hypothetical protein
MTDHASVPSPAGCPAAVTGNDSPTFVTAGRVPLFVTSHVKTVSVSLSVRTTPPVLYCTWTCTLPAVVASKIVCAEPVVGSRLPPPVPPTMDHARSATPAGCGSHSSKAACAAYFGKFTRLTSRIDTERLS